MKKIIVLLLIVLVSTHLSFGQNSDQDVVGLKIESGYQIGVGDYGMDRLKLNVVGTHQLNPFLSLGLGAGLRYYSDIETALIPVFADVWVRGSEGKISPYFSMGVGYSFDATNGFEGVGFFLNPSVGVSFKMAGNSTMNLGLGYEMQKMNIGFFNIYEGYYYGYSYYGYTGYYDYSYSIPRRVNSDAICLSLGISF